MALLTDTVRMPQLALFSFTLGLEDAKSIVIKRGGVVLARDHWT